MTHSEKSENHSTALGLSNKIRRGGVFHSLESLLIVPEERVRNESEIDCY